MPLFDYKVTDQQNKVTSGSLTASSKEELAETLKKKGLNPVSIKPTKEKVNTAGTLPTIELIAFCRYMSTMINAGLSLTDGIPSLKEETKNPLMRQILDDLLYGLEHGQPLSTVLSNYPKVFDEFFLTLIKSGEVSGTLADAFKYLEKQLRAEYSLIQKIKSALMYPSIVFIAMAGIGFLMFFFILPQIAEVFLTMTIPLPTYTKVIFTFSVTTAQYKFPIIVVSVISIIALLLFLRKPAGKKVISSIIAPIPVVSNLIQQIDIARFCRIFSTLVASAVPITDALKIALSSLNHPKFTSVADEIIDQIIHGKSITVAFSQYKVFPGLLTQMISAGEKSGTLDTALTDLADFYEEEVEEAVKKSTQLLEPLLMLVVGIGVGALIFAIIAPLYSVVGNLQA